MGMRTHNMQCWLALLLCSLILTLALVACGFGSSSPGSSSTSTTSSTTFVSYSGDGFTITYPQGWKANKENTGATFSDPNGIAYLTIRTSQNPLGLLSTDAQVNVGLQAFKSQAKNYQQVDVPATTTIAGENWRQGAATGDLVPQGKSTAVNVKLVVDSDNHPAQQATTKAYIIAYATGSQVFDLATTTYFQPMLQSFKFV